MFVENSHPTDVLPETVQGMCNSSRSRLFVVRGQPTYVFPKLFKVYAVLTSAIPKCL